VLKLSIDTVRQPKQYSFLSSQRKVSKEGRHVPDMIRQRIVASVDRALRLERKTDVRTYGQMSAKPKRGKRRPNNQSIN